MARVARNLGKGDTGIFSPRGSKLAVDYSGDPCYDYPGSGSSSDPEKGLYLSDANGSHRRRIAGDALVGWLPSGRLIVQREVPSAPRLFDPLSRRVLMDFPTTPDLLAMSCSGRVALSLPVNRGYELDIYTRVRERGEQEVELVRRRVTSRRYPFSDLSWSPDGRWLLFEPNSASPYYTTRSGSLWRVAVNGERSRRLSHAGVREADEFPDWSPDGQRIAFQRFALNPDGPRSYKILVMNADGSHVHAIARSSDFYLDSPPHWSPDSKSVAFDIGLDIRVANATTGTIERTSSPGRGLEDWQALPDHHPTRCADRQPAPLNAGKPTGS